MCSHRKRQLEINLVVLGYLLQYKFKFMWNDSTLRSNCRCSFYVNISGEGGKSLNFCSWFSLSKVFCPNLLEFHIILQFGFFFPFLLKPKGEEVLIGRKTPFFGETNCSCRKSSGSSVSGTSGSRISRDTCLALEELTFESVETTLLPVDVLLPVLPVLPWLLRDSPAFCFMSSTVRLFGELSWHFWGILRVETASGESVSWLSLGLGLSARGDLGVATAFGVLPWDLKEVLRLRPLGLTWAIVGLVTGDDISTTLFRFEFGLTSAEVRRVGRRKLFESCSIDASSSKWSTNSVSRRGDDVTAASSFRTGADPTKEVRSCRLRFPLRLSLSFDRGDLGKTLSSSFSMMMFDLRLYCAGVVDADDSKQTDSEKRENEVFYKTDFKLIHQVLCKVTALWRSPTSLWHFNFRVVFNKTLRAS